MTSYLCILKSSIAQTWCKNSNNATFVFRNIIIKVARPLRVRNPRRVLHSRRQRCQRVVIMFQRHDIVHPLIEIFNAVPMNLSALAPTHSSCVVTTDTPTQATNQSNTFVAFYLPRCPSLSFCLPYPWSLYVESDALPSKIRFFLSLVSRRRSGSAGRRPRFDDVTT